MYIRLHMYIALYHKIALCEFEKDISEAKQNLEEHL